MNKGLLFPLIIGVLSVILSCCSTETKEISLVSVEKTSSLRQEQMTVINSCLPHIIPKEAYVHARKLEPDTSVNLNLFVYGIFCVLDSTTIQSLVEQGGSPLLTQLNKKHTQSESINPANLESFHRVHVSCIPPMTKSEIRANLGGINLSKVVFDDDKKQAVVLVDFAQRLNKGPVAFQSEVHLSKRQNNWQVTEIIPITSGIILSL